MTGPAPRILEIGLVPLMAQAYPDSTDHWSLQTPDAFDGRNPRHQLVTFASLPRLWRAIREQRYDLIVVQPMSYRPWQSQAIVRSLFRRSALKGVVPYGRYFGPELIRANTKVPVAIWDWDDPPFIPRHNVFFLDRATCYFKRELPPDHWRVFMNTLHPRLPTPRFRSKPKNSERVAKLRPISLGVPLGLDRDGEVAKIAGREKTADIFFAGRVAGSSTVRTRGMAELLALRDKGIVVDIPDNNLDRHAYLERCASAWLVWSPEGYGYDCFRHYEAPLCGSVPLINAPTIDRYKPLQDGVHCFYYDPEPGGLTRAVERALSDKPCLAAMARTGRDFAIAEHTIAALARYVAETTLSAGAPRR